MHGYGLLVYPPVGGKFNLGDYIQSLAAERFLPRVDAYVDREALDAVDVPDRLRMILNGWFMHNPENWPPDPRIQPLITSFHINRSASAAMTSSESIRYLQTHAPIGCRDLATLHLLRQHQVETYFSACLTLTLERARFSQPASARKGIFLVDPVPGLSHWARLLRNPLEFSRAVKHARFGQPARLRAILERILDPESLAAAKILAHRIPTRFSSHRQRFDLARQRLGLYANAELVITSRIHCALPCIAFGTPVIFVNSSAADEISTCRFDGLIDLLNVVDVDPDSLDIAARFDAPLPVSPVALPRNPDKHLQYKRMLERVCSTFVETGRRDGP